MLTSYDEKLSSIEESIHLSVWSLQVILWDVKIASMDFIFVMSAINWILMILQTNWGYHCPCLLLTHIEVFFYGINR